MKLLVTVLKAVQLAIRLLFFAVSLSRSSDSSVFNYVPETWQLAWLEENFTFNSGMSEWFTRYLQAQKNSCTNWNVIYWEYLYSPYVLGT